METDEITAPKFLRWANERLTAGRQRLSPELLLMMVVVVMVMVMMVVVGVGPRSGRGKGKGNNRDQKHRRENFVHHILLSPLKLVAIADCVGI